MFAALKKLKFFRDRRSSIITAFALMAVPLFVSAEASVDISRLVTARALLQASVDNAANAGVSAWHLSESPAYAANVATAAFNGSAATLSDFGSYSAPTEANSGLQLACTDPNGTNDTVCNVGGVSTPTYSATPATYACANPGTPQYCVVVTASVTVNNWFYSHFLSSSSLLTVTGVGSQPLATVINGTNVPPSPGFGSAGDVSAINAYAVPMTGAGSSATPEFNSVPTPNSGCASYSSFGPLALLKSSSSTSSTCNYLFIALSTSSGTSSAGGSLTLSENQPIAFTFTNYTGANGYHSTNYVTSTVQLEISENGGSYVYHQSGGTYPDGYNTLVTTCTGNLSGGNCTTSSTNYTVTSNTNSTSGTVGTHTTSHSHNGTTTYTTTTVTPTSALTTNFYGSCPDHTLYGSLDSMSVNTTTGANNDGIPVANSLNVYSSAYEILGEPPTYLTNHALIPFISPVVVPFTDSSGNTYNVKAICPNYSRTNTTIRATESTAYQTETGWSGLDIYSTAFPGLPYTDTDNAANPPDDTTGVQISSGSSDIYPPSISGCTPAYSDQDGTITTSTVDPWWNWITNSSGTSITNSGNCGNESSTYTSADTTAAFNTPATTLANGNSAYQPTYSNCTLLIQDLGTTGGTYPTVPTGTFTISGTSYTYAQLPDYYVIVSSSATLSSSSIVGLDPIYDGKSWYDSMPGVITNHLGGNDSKISVTQSSTTTTVNGVPTTIYYDYITDTDTGATYNSDGTVTMPTGYVGHTPTNSTPTSYQLTAANYTAPTSGTSYLGDYVFIEKPASYTNGSSTIYEFNLPAETSSQCYNPQLNGNTSGANGISIQAGPDASPSAVTFTPASAYNLPTTAQSIDQVANPNLGAILCNSAVPETYAMYWNDLGTYDSDDLGYWNAINAFTCSTPGTSRAGGLATLSG